MDGELLLKAEQRKWFLETDSTPGEDAVKIIEMTIKDLKHDLILLIKKLQGLRGWTQILKESTVGKMLSHSIAGYREIVCKRNSQSTWQISLLFYCKKCPQPPQPSANTTLISQHH